MKPESFLPDEYRPAEDEPFMNDRQLEYFRRKLVAWKNDILAESRDTIEALQEATRNIPDVTDRASEETDDFRASAIKNSVGLCHRVRIGLHPDERIDRA